MKKKVKRKFNFLKLLAFLLIIYILFFSVKYIINYKTKNIIILDNKYYSDEEIIQTAKIQDYPKFFLASKSKIKKRLKALDLVENATISKIYPGILQINVKEKKVLYFNRSTSKYKVSDDNYYSFDTKYNVPTLINYIPESIEDKFAKGMSNIDINIIENISEIEYSKTSYDDERFLLYMNDGNLVYITISKIESLNKYLSILEQLNNKKGILYLDSGNYFEVKE